VGQTHPDHPVADQDVTDHGGTRPPEGAADHGGDVMTALLSEDPRTDKELVRTDHSPVDGEAAPQPRPVGVDARVPARNDLRIGAVPRSRPAPDEHPRPNGGAHSATVTAEHPVVTPRGRHRTGYLIGKPRIVALPLGVILLMRPKHYLKNILIFLPLVFGHALADRVVLGRTLLAFAAFSVLASAVYVVNDLRDVELDRRHPVKRNRPIAAGAVPRSVAVVEFVALLGLAGYLSWLTGSHIVGYLLLASYLVINVGYSFGLKNTPILDVSILAVGFILRVYYGADTAGIVVSDWLYLTVFAFSFFASFGKRRNEILQTGTATRKANARYIPAFLDKAMYLTAAITVVFYALWTIDQSQTHKHLTWTVPLVLVIFLLYILKVEQPNQGGDPTEIITGSRPLLVLSIVYAVVIVVLLYGLPFA
jgi:decaprenyl-phosphate phosphoribosyltransferase